jgi:hypothetical protein
MTGEIILVDLVFRTVSGKSLSAKSPGIKANELEQYEASKETQELAIKELKRLGFRIVVANSRGLSVSGSRNLVQKTFGSGKLKIPESLAQYIETATRQPKGEFY